MAFELRTTTGTVESVQAALGLTPDVSPATESPAGVVSMTVPEKSETPDPQAAPATETPDLGGSLDELVAQPEVPGESPQQRGARTRRNLQQRFDELTREKYMERGAREAAEREAARLRDLVERMQVTSGTPAQPAQPTTPQAPTPAPEAVQNEEYLTIDSPGVTDYDDLLRKNAAIEARKAARAEWHRLQQEQLAQQEQARRAQAAEAIQQTYQERFQTFVSQNPSAQEVFRDQSIRVSPSVELALVHNEHGPEVAYYLATHPDELAQVNSLNVASAAMRIGLIEGQLLAGHRPGSAPAMPTASMPKAPPPPTPVTGRAATPASTLHDLAKAHDIQAFNAMRAEQEARRRAGR